MTSCTRSPSANVGCGASALPGRSGLDVLAHAPSEIGERAVGRAGRQDLLQRARSAREQHAAVATEDDRAVAAVEDDAARGMVDRARELDRRDRPAAHAQQQLRGVVGGHAHRLTGRRRPHLRRDPELRRHAIDGPEPPDERIDPVRSQRAEQAAGAVAPQPPFLTRTRRVDEHAGHLHDEREPHLTDRARLEELFHLRSCGRVAELVVDRVHDAGALGRSEHLARLTRVARHRLLADDVLARGERREGVFAVQCRRRRDAHDVDIVPLDELIDRVDRGGDLGLLGRRASARRIRRADRRYFVPRAAEAGDLHARAEARPDYPHPQRHCRTV